MNTDNNVRNYEFNPYNSKRNMLPKGNNPYKEVNRFKQEYIKINRINEKKNKRIQSSL